MNDILLCIHTSSGYYSVNIYNYNNGNILFDSLGHRVFDHSRSLADMLTVGLQMSGIRAKDITFVFVDTGPGKSGATRAGVVFANTFSYALGISVYGVNAFELLGFDKSIEFQLPVVCVRKACFNKYFFAVYQEDILRYRYTLDKESMESKIYELSPPFVLSTNTNIIDHMNICDNVILTDDRVSATSFVTYASNKLHEYYSSGCKSRISDRVDVCYDIC